MAVDFNWDGSFGYKSVGNNNFSALVPTPSPMMTGGVFAIYRDNFWRLGGYDSGMYGWGGENFELSFKVWLCGGSVDVVSCSHVAHLDRDSANRPYKDPDGRSTNNMMRATEVWADEYRSTFNLFYSGLEPSSIDLNERFDIKKSLNCKSFSWYVENVIPEKYIPDKQSKYYGQLYSGENKDICVDNLSQGRGSFVGKYGCNTHLSSSQFFSISLTNEFRNLYFCAEISNEISFDKIKLNTCNGDLNQKWVYTKPTLRHIVSGKCATLPSALKILENDITVEGFKHLVAIPCNDLKEQHWTFEFNTNETVTENALEIEKNGRYGRIRNERFKNMCLDSYSQEPPYLLSQYPCEESSLVATQNFSISKHNELRHSMHCAEVHFCSGVYCGNQYRILMNFCNNEEEQIWYKTGWNGIMHGKHKMCLTSSPGYARHGETLLALPCDKSIDQIWNFN